MSWKKHFRVIKGIPQAIQNPLDASRYGGGSSTSANFSSFLPLVYAGHPNRVTRYYQFDDMDRDSDINAALDTISDFCTQSEEQNDELFDLQYTGEPNESEVKILKTMLDKWTQLNNFHSRLWYMFRDCLKNGDAFFLRDPETQEWLWLDHFMVEMVKVDDVDGKEPDEYLVRGLDYNRQIKFGTKKADPNQYRTPYGTSNVGASRVTAVSASSAPAAFSLAGTAVDPRQRHMMGPFAQDVSVIDAQFVVHLSLSIGNDINWPFGASILEPIFKTFKQKELLEDSIIIYRVQRAPERRIFYIDTGTMPPERAKRHIEAIKNDIHQRRIPNRTGTGGSILDAAYNPLCLHLSTLLPLVDGRILTLNDLIMEHRDGKENWVYSCNPVTGEIVTAPITWAGVTRTNAEVVCVTLDNGGAVIVTPDHKFPILGGGLVQARDLMPEHELISRERFAHTDKDGIVRRTGHGPDHMIVHPLSVVSLQDKIDVGTITVDKDELYHPYHNFAISENIFLQNSINDDYFFAQCFSLNVPMILLDGRTITLAEIIAEHEQGKQNWVYSLNRQTHELEPGRITWAGVTRKDADVMRITLDNGQHIDVTPDHRFVLRDGSEKQAAELKDGDSLMPLYLREGRTGPRQKNAGYTRYLCNATGKTKFVHTAICPKPSGREWVVHHKDFNPKNNDPTNLVVMSWADHEKLHKDAGTYSLGKQWADPESRGKLIAGMHKLYKNATPDFLDMLSTRNRVNGANTWTDPKTAGRVKASLRIHCAKQLEQRTLKFTPQLFQRVIELYDQGYNSVKKMCQVLRYDEQFLQLYRDANIDTKRCIDEGQLSWVDDSTLNKIVATAGYSSWGDFKQNYARNHMVVSVEFLPDREDTGDITIESPSGSHVFALAAGVYVHNSTDGRGSKVETLPGGELTGEIGDLMFFSRKLARGLRVPTSYLNLGEDDGAGSNVTFNDGKLGAAMIQEHRFSKFCMRLQGLLAPVFDKEFKRFLLKNGIEIEWNLFRLAFTPPQSFTRYRQLELDAQRTQVYASVAENKILAHRFKLARYLGLTEDEIIENEKQWAEENAAKLKKKVGATPAETEAGAGLGDVGLHPGGDMDMDMEMAPEDANAEAGGAAPGGPTGAPPGGEAAPPAAGAMGGAPPPAA